MWNETLWAGRLGSARSGVRRWHRADVGPGQRPVHRPVRAVRGLPRRAEPDRLAHLQQRSAGARRADRATTAPTSPPATSSRPPSRTGRASSCRWAPTSCSPSGSSRRARRSRSHRRATRELDADPDGRSATTRMPRAGAARRVRLRCTRTPWGSRSRSSSCCRWPCTPSAAPASTAPSRWRTGGSPVSVWRFVTTSTFWFQSFQNWQSEFVAVGSDRGALDLPPPATARPNRSRSPRLTTRPATDGRGLPGASGEFRASPIR